MSISSRINEMSSHIEQAYDELQGLGADLTNVNKNIENISVVLDDIYDSLPSVSGEGTSLTLDDTRVGKIKSTLKGNTSQDGTPTPSSPIPVNVVSGDNEINVVGKNLFDGILELGGYTNGGKYNNTDNYRNANIIQVNPNTTYTFSINGTKQKYVIITYGSTQNFKQEILNDTGTFTTASDIYYINFRCYQADFTSNYANLRVQLEKGSSATNFEPYQGNNYNIDLPVENLLQLSSATSVTATTNINGNAITMTQTGNWGTTTWEVSNLQPNTQYTLSFELTAKETNYNPYYRVSATTGIDGYVATNGLNKYSKSITTDNNGKVYFNFRPTASNGVTGSATIKNVQLEKGSKANSFSEYGITPIELCKIGNYQDYFYKDNGKWYLHKEIGKVVLDGTETISSYDATSLSGSYQATFEITTKATSTDKIVLSNYFASALLSDRTTKTNIIYSYSDGLLRIATNIATTMADFKTWLSTHNVVVYYVLATPVNTALEDM